MSFPPRFWDAPAAGERRGLFYFSVKIFSFWGRLPESRVTKCGRVGELPRIPEAGEGDPVKTAVIR